jgi:hypothetical protein
MQGRMGRPQLQRYYLLFASKFTGNLPADCLVCKSDDACANFPIGGDFMRDEDETVSNMTCYKGGITVNRNFQMCDVTSKMLLEQFIPAIAD